MPYAFLQDGSLATCSKLTSVPEGVESVEFERGGLPAAPEALSIVAGAIVVDGAKSSAIAVAAEEKWVAEELAAADVVINMKADGHGRGAGGSLAQWGQYRNDLRDHVIGGVLQGARPTKPI